MKGGTLINMKGGVDFGNNVLPRNVLRATKGKCEYFSKTNSPIKHYILFKKT